MQNMQKQYTKKYVKYASNMQVLMILPYIACNMQNMQKNMHDMQNMQTPFSICRICTAHFADGATGPARRAGLWTASVSRSCVPWAGLQIVTVTYSSVSMPGPKRPAGSLGSGQALLRPQDSPPAPGTRTGRAACFEGSRLL